MTGQFRKTRKFTRLPVTYLNRAPQRGTDSKLHRYKKTRKTRKRRRFVGGHQEIIIAPSRTFDLQQINIVNKNTIYSITIDECIYYFFGQNKKYLLVLINHEYYILKLHESYDDIDMTLLEGIEQKLPVTNEREEMELRKHLRRTDILYFRYDVCHKSLDLRRAQAKVLELTRILQTKCPNLSLHLDYIYNMHPPNNMFAIWGTIFPNPYLLVLCLYNEHGCISSISIKLERDTINIDSVTDSNFEGKKYNKLLRSVVILISVLLPLHISRIISLAINPISAYLLITYFGGIIPPPAIVPDNIEFFTFLQESHITITPETDYKELFEKYKKDFGLIVYIEPTTKNIENAERKFHAILDEIKCS
jgi:hypothetical protein